MRTQTVTSKFTVRSQFGVYFGISEVGAGASSFTFNGTASSTLLDGTYLPPTKVTVVGAYDVVFTEHPMTIRLPDLPRLTKPVRRPQPAPDAHLEEA